MRPCGLRWSTAQGSMSYISTSSTLHTPSLRVREVNTPIDVLLSGVERRTVMTHTWIRLDDGEGPADEVDAVEGIVDILYRF